MSWWSAVLPVLTLVLGWAGSELSEARWNKRAAALSRTERAATRLERAREQRENFERENLDAMFNAISRLGRATAVHHLADIDAANATGRPYAGSVLSDKAMDEELRLATVEAGRLTVLVLDDHLRAQVDEAVASTQALGMTQSTIADANLAFQQVTTELRGAQRAIAQRLRELYKEEGTP
jgi:hypothetical protein